MYTSTSTKGSMRIPQTYLENPLLVSKKYDTMASTIQTNYMPSTTNPNFVRTTAATNFNNPTKTSTKTYISPSSQRFRWKEIIKLNPSDQDSFQPYLNNILFGNIEESEIQILPENYISQLIRILQSIAYTSINENNSLKEMIKGLNERVLQLQNQVNVNANHIELIDSLRRQNEEMTRLLKNYKKYVNDNKTIINNSNLIDSDDSLIQETSIRQERYYCIYCSGKKFSTPEYLEDHMRRRHLINNYTFSDGKNVKKTTVNNSSKLIDSKINEMKSQMQNLLISTPMENNYKNLNDKIGFLQSRLYQSQNGKNNISYYPNMGSSTYPLNETIIKTGNENNNGKLTLSEARLLQQTIQNINNNIERNNKNFSHRFKEITNEMNRFRVTISNEISSMKQSQSFERVKTSMSRTSSQEDYTSNNFKYILPTRRKTKKSTVNSLKLTIRKEEENKKDNPNAITNIHIHNKDKDKNNHNENTNPEIEHLQTSSSNMNIISKPKEITSNQPAEVNKTPMAITKAHNENIEGKPKESDNIINNESDKFSSSVSQTEEEKEIQNFYIKFKNRDGNYNGNIEDYLQKTVPDYYMLPNEYIEKKKELLTKIALQKSSNNELDSIPHLKNLTQEGLINLINDMYEHIGNKSSEPQSDYGYYATNLDFLLNTKEIITEENRNYFNKKIPLTNSFGLKNSFASNGRLFENVNYIIE